MPDRRPVHPRRVAAAGLALAGAGLVAWGLLGGGSPEEPVRAVPPASSPSPRPSVPGVLPTTTPTLEPTADDPAAGPPQRVLIPALEVDAPVVGIRPLDGVLVPPDDPQTLGWWDQGAVPGAAHGGALVTGHTVHTGGGALDDLETLHRGDPVSVRTDRGTVRYEVVDVAVYRKATLARDSASLFSQQVPGHLVLVTCEDWDGTRYLSNVVVLARPVAAS